MMGLSYNRQRSGVLCLSSFMVLVMASLSPTASYAFSFSPSASITIVSAVGVSEQQGLNFATINKPETSVVVEVTPDGALGSNTTASMAGGSSPTAGVYTISGSATQTISITASNVGNVEGISFNAISGKYNNGSTVNLVSGVSGLVPPGAGKALALGGTLTIQPTIGTGTFAPQIALNINYE